MNLENKSHSNTIQENIELTDIAMDLGNYIQSSQLELSKKIPKWKSVVEKMVKEIDGSQYELVVNAVRKKHLMKYCSGCDEKVIFIFDEWRDSYNHKKPWRKVNVKFYAKYLEYRKALIADAEAFFLAKKAENELALKVKMDAHQSTEVICECGGKYSMRNKSKHSKTQKHLTFCKSTL